MSTPPTLLMGKGTLYPGLYLTGGLGVELPAKISDPPAAIKKRKGGSTFYVRMH